VQAAQVRYLLRLFKIEADNLQPLAVIPGVEFGQKRSLVVAVGAPTAGDTNEPTTVEPLVSRSR
jgi:hypothetical protein